LEQQSVRIACHRWKYEYVFCGLPGERHELADEYSAISAGLVATQSDSVIFIPRIRYKNIT
jgi:hypothetical protein